MIKSKSDPKSKISQYLRQGSPIREIESGGYHSIHRFVSDPKYLDNLKDLLENDETGSLVNIKDYRGKTALYWCADYRNLEAARVLIQYGAIVDLPEFYKLTPLIVAVSRKDLDMVKLLLSAGANPYHAAHEDGTANVLEYARDQGLEWEETLRTLFAEYSQRPVDESKKRKVYCRIE